MFFVRDWELRESSICNVFNFIFETNFQNVFDVLHGLEIFVLVTCWPVRVWVVGRRRAPLPTWKRGRAESWGHVHGWCPAAAAQSQPTAGPCPCWPAVPCGCHCCCRCWWHFSSTTGLMMSLRPQERSSLWCAGAARCPSEWRATPRSSRPTGRAGSWLADSHGTGMRSRRAPSRDTSRPRLGRAFRQALQEPDRRPVSADNTRCFGRFLQTDEQPRTWNIKKFFCDTFYSLTYSKTAKIKLNSNQEPGGEYIFQAMIHTFYPLFL